MNRTAQDNEREDWTDLVQSKGWQRLVAYVTNELKTQFDEKVSALVKKGGTVENIRQLVAVREYVTKDVLLYPESRIRALTKAEDLRTATVPAGHRRGPHL